MSKLLINFVSLDDATLSDHMNMPKSLTGTLTIEFVSSGDMSRFIKADRSLDKTALFHAMNLPTTIELK